MKKFLLHTFVLLIILLIIVFSVFSLADGSSDAFYLRFTTPKQKALIVGSSRAAQGVQPKSIDSILENTILYNYAFTSVHTPYGEIYYKSIVKKVDTKNATGPFLVCVNPWTVASTLSYEKNEHLRESGNFIDQTSQVCLNPNIEYLVESYKQKYIKILSNKKRKGAYQTFFLNDDGWLKVTIESDMISREQRTKSKMISYKEKLKSFRGLSSYRMKYLKKTLDFLSRYGKVYLIRLPIHQDMHKIENQLMPNFDKEMLSLSEISTVRYINMMPHNADYTYTDGNHLDIHSGKLVSMFLAQEIIKN